MYYGVCMYRYAVAQSFNTFWANQRSDILQEGPAVCPRELYTQKVYILELILIYMCIHTHTYAHIIAEPPEPTMPDQPSTMPVETMPVQPPTMPVETIPAQSPMVTTSPTPTQTPAEDGGGTIGSAAGTANSI